MDFDDEVDWGMGDDDVISLGGDDIGLDDLQESTKMSPVKSVNTTQLPAASPVAKPAPASPPKPAAAAPPPRAPTGPAGDNRGARNDRDRAGPPERSRLPPKPEPARPTRDEPPRGPRRDMAANGLPPKPLSAQRDLVRESMSLKRDTRGRECNGRDVREQAGKEKEPEEVATSNADSKNDAKTENTIDRDNIVTPVVPVSNGSAARRSERRATPPPADDPNADLPPNWQAIMSNSQGKYFFHNKVTGETKWDKPTAGDDAKEKEKDKGTTDSTSRSQPQARDRADRRDRGGNDRPQDRRDKDAPSAPRDDRRRDPPSGPRDDRASSSASNPPPPARLQDRLSGRIGDRPAPASRSPQRVESSTASQPAPAPPIHPDRARLLGNGAPPRGNDRAPLAPGLPARPAVAERDRTSTSKDVPTNLTLFQQQAQDTDRRLGAAATNLEVRLREDATRTRSPPRAPAAPRLDRDRSDRTDNRDSERKDDEAQLAEPRAERAPPVHPSRAALLPPADRVNVVRDTRDSRDTRDTRDTLPPRAYGPGSNSDGRGSAPARNDEPAPRWPRREPPSGPRSANSRDASGSASPQKPAVPAEQPAAAAENDKPVESAEARRARLREEAERARDALRRIEEEEAALAREDKLKEEVRNSMARRDEAKKSSETKEQDEKKESEKKDEAMDVDKPQTQTGSETPGGSDNDTLRNAWARRNEPLPDQRLSPSGSSGRRRNRGGRKVREKEMRGREREREMAARARGQPLRQPIGPGADTSAGFAPRDGPSTATTAIGRDPPPHTSADPANNAPRYGPNAPGAARPIHDDRIPSGYGRRGGGRESEFSYSTKDLPSGYDRYVPGGDDGPSDRSRDRERDRDRGGRDRDRERDRERGRDRERDRERDRDRDRERDRPANDRKRPLEGAAYPEREKRVRSPLGPSSRESWGERREREMRERERERR